ARWQAEIADLSAVSVRSQARALPGIFVLAASVSSASASKAIAAAQKVLSALAQNGPTAGEIAEAWSVIARTNASGSSPEMIADEWLDIETFKLPSSAPRSSRDPADFQRLAARLFKDGAIAKVVVGDTEQFKASFGENLEVAGSKPEAKSSPSPSNPTRKP